MGVVQFIENLDKTSLTVSDGVFEKNVEAAILAIVDRRVDEVPLPKPHQLLEKSGISEPETIPQNSANIECVTPRRLISPDAGITDRILKNNGIDESRAVSGLLRSIQKPLSSIGRIFSEEPSSQPPPSLSPRLSPAVFQPPRKSSDERKLYEKPQENFNWEQNQLNHPNAEDVAVRQASADAAEAQRIQRVEHQDVVESVTFNIFREALLTLK